MKRLFFITHPEVVADPDRPVPRWYLSEKGIVRMRACAAMAEMQTIRSVWASGETKAIEAAGILAGALGLPVGVRHDLHENDRSATGFLPPAEFEEVANQFFAKPEESIRGWERAIDAQTRIVAAFNSIVEHQSEGDVAIVAHGGVGTLLLCHLLGVPISRDLDQAFQGHYWTYLPDARNIVHRWKPIAPR